MKNLLYIIFLLSTLTSYTQENNDFFDYGFSVRIKQNLEPQKPKIAFAASFDAFFKINEKFDIKTGVSYTDHGCVRTYKVHNPGGNWSPTVTNVFRYDFIGVPLGLLYKPMIKRSKLLLYIGWTFEGLVNASKMQSTFDPIDNFIISQYFGIGMIAVKEDPFDIGIEIIGNFSYMPMEYRYESARPASIGVQLSCRFK